MTTAFAPGLAGLDDEQLGAAYFDDDADVDAIDREHQRREQARYVPPEPPPRAAPAPRPAPRTSDEIRASIHARSPHLATAPRHAAPAEVTAITSPERAQVAVRQPGTVARYAEPPEPIDGAEILDYIWEYLYRAAIWPSDEAITGAALYLAAAWGKNSAGLPIWPFMARFFLTSNLPGSGKSWIARIMAALAPNGKSLIEPTKASLIDLLAEHATVVITEAEQLFGSGARNRGIVAVLNAGYEPGHVHTRKSHGRVQEIPLFCPAIIDGLDSMINATGLELRSLVSRCIIIHLGMGPENYRPPRFDERAQKVAAILSGRLARWMQQEVANGIGEVVPEMPDGVGNRAAALWEPLICCADAAGGRWPELGRQACVALVGSTTPAREQDDEDNLLGDFFTDDAGAEW